MTEDEIRAAVREVALEILELEPEELADEADLEDLGGDSIMRLELVSALQQRLGVRYTVDDEVRINSVKSAVEITQNVLAS
ncbi:hypothetical protein AQ490_17870 [Wenjunlia vitaminophila]|uniref:Carrier domain-containing protein n=1 Tax=Wenjunlia vitaminophila TaxID=76728 RepID=A0A0T6LV07_WENVI|nr:acyl carrier protein [Wenjunlia vitaminophila]KRV49931.1 hypothetical protein AQ490_17870 [Wenjunlia vitaminophila]